MDINTTAPHLWNQLQKMGGGGGRGVVVQLLISEITESVLDYPILDKKWHAYFYTYLSNMVSSTQSLVQIKAKEFVGYIKQHFTTSSLACLSRFCKMLYQTLGAPWPSTQQHAIW